MPSGQSQTNSFDLPPLVGANADTKRVFVATRQRGVTLNTPQSEVSFQSNGTAPSHGAQNMNSPGYSPAFVSPAPAHAAPASDLQLHTTDPCAGWFASNGAHASCTSGARNTGAFRARQPAPQHGAQESSIPAPHPAATAYAVPAGAAAPAAPVYMNSCNNSAPMSNQQAAAHSPFQQQQFFPQQVAPPFAQAIPMPDPRGFAQPMSGTHMSTLPSNFDGNLSTGFALNQLHDVSSGEGRGTDVSGGGQPHTQRWGQNLDRQRMDAIGRYHNAGATCTPGKYCNIALARLDLSRFDST